MAEVASVAMIAPQSVERVVSSQEAERIGELVWDDIECAAEWWEREKHRFLPEVGREFVRIVRPSAAVEAHPSDRDMMLANMAMTEWFMFERSFGAEGTPLEMYRDHCQDPDCAARLAQVIDTQFFSRFSILDKDLESGMAVLQSLANGRRYDVYDPHVCEVPHWKDGVIAERIAKVDGLWLIVGQMHLYDHAPADETGADAPGSVHPEDRDQAETLESAGSFLRLLRDCIGHNGRYRSTLKVFSA
ncbi:hypothetical protein K6V98_01780 [Collinsella sp. AGMB00827]|uniref:Uncharacterized protein n=1 Tax=Collinsella ureilytica TaxID=2869515 RepID=A0ABS7MIA0_9ACTN|nr:hypothetical protein [Collinsella urealyticum]MBY4797094.1 hypothetical protein [Collinsella urealyticum]